MTPMGTWTESVWAIAALQALLLAPPAVLVALLLRRTGAPGGRVSCAIVAGIFAGLAAGPGILGRAWPDVHQRVMVGGVEEEQALRALLMRQETDRAALLAASVTPTAVSELEIDQRAARRPLEEELDSARRGHRERLDLLAAFLVALHLVLIGPGLVPGTARGLRRLGQSAVATGWRAPAVGLIALALAALPPLLVLPLFVALPREQCFAFGLVLAVPGLALTLRPGVYIACAAALASCLALAMMIGWSAGMAIAGAGMSFGLLIPLGIESRVGRSVRRLIARGAMAITLPTVAAMGAVRLDLFALVGPPAGAGPLTADAQAFWPALVIAVMWCSDGRWVAWRTAWRLVGWERVRLVAWTAGSAPLDAGAGPAQLTLAVVLAGAGLVNDGVMAGVLAGAALVALVGYPRRWLARRIDLGNSEAGTETGPDD